MQKILWVRVKVEVEVEVEIEVKVVVKIPIRIPDDHCYFVSLEVSRNRDSKSC